MVGPITPRERDHTRDLRAIACNGGKFAGTRSASRRKRLTAGRLPAKGHRRRGSGRLHLPSRPVTARRKYPPSTARRNPDSLRERSCQRLRRRPALRVTGPLAAAQRAVRAGRETLPARLHGTGGRLTPAALRRCGRAVKRRLLAPTEASRQGANLTRLGTLRQSEEIIVPVSIRVGSQVLPATIAGIHDTYLGPVSRRIHDEEGVRLGFDVGNYVLGGPLPTGSANMGDPVFGTIPIWFRYTGDLNVCHVVLQEGSLEFRVLTQGQPAPIAHSQLKMQESFLLQQVIEITAGKRPIWITEEKHNRSRKRGRPAPRTCGFGVESTRTDERPTPRQGRPSAVPVSAPDGVRDRRATTMEKASWSRLPEA